MICRKEVFRVVGAFDPTLHFGEDIDWLTIEYQQDSYTKTTRTGADLPTAPREHDL
jgi:hypothetical protein